MQRTDVHRPSALVTEDYTYLASADLNPRPEDMYPLEREEAEAINAALDARGRDVYPQCDHCGARSVRYVAFLRHNPTGEVIMVGWQCLENRFQRASTDFQRLRKTAELIRQSQRIRHAVAQFVAKYPDLAVLDQKELPPVLAWNSFLVDLAHKLRTYGELSEKQVAAARRSIEEAPAKQACYLAKKAEREALEAAAQPVPTGRVTVTGEILGFKTIDSQFGSTLKMIVRDDRGFKVFGTVPRGLDCDKGSRVTFVATVEPSREDKKFGYYSRPTKPAVL